MTEQEERKSLTVKLKSELLNRFNSVVKGQGLKNQFVVEQLVTDYVENTNAWHFTMGQKDSKPELTSTKEG
jgi:metal-responsive CopG/Arc/MetJ family transcriptional regulator